MKETTTHTATMITFGVNAEMATYIMDALESRDDEIVEYNSGVDTLDPEQLMMLAEEAQEEVLETDTSYGIEVVQPKSRLEAFPAAKGSRFIRRPIEVGFLDNMWREFFFTARAQVQREKLQRLAEDRRPRLWVTED
jgi:hypothetical protein